MTTMRHQYILHLLNKNIQTLKTVVNNLKLVVFVTFEFPVHYAVLFKSVFVRKIASRQTHKSVGAFVNRTKTFDISNLHIKNEK